MKRWQFQSWILAFAILLPHLDAAQSNLFIVFATYAHKNWDHAKQIAIDLLEPMDIGPSATQVSLFTSATRTPVKWTLTKYSNKADLINAIRNLPYPNGATNLAGALYTIRTMKTDRPVVFNTGIIITDGTPTDSSTVRVEIERVHEAGINTFAIGITSEIGDSVDVATLKQLSSYPQQLNQNYFLIPGGGRRGDVLQALKNAILGPTKPTQD